MKNAQIGMKGKMAKIRHQIVGFRQGDWIIYRCPQCDYEMHRNITSQQLVIKNATSEVAHSGTYQPFKVEWANDGPRHNRAAWGLN